MAEIYAFPGDASRRPGEGAGPRRPEGVPDEVWRAVESVRAMERVPGVSYRELPIPTSMADYGIGVAVDCVSGDAHAAGWVAVLYSHRTRRDWGSRWRCVAFAGIDLPERADDAFAPRRCWNRMRSHLAGHAAGIDGTVTIIRDTAFGKARTARAPGCELRVSWTPLDKQGSGPDAGTQVMLWSRFVRSTVVHEEEPPVDR